MDIESRTKAQQLFLPIANHPPPSRPRTPILKLKTDFPVSSDEAPTHPQTPLDAWDWPIALRQLTALLLFALQFFITISWHPGFLSLAVSASSNSLFIADSIITCLAVVISSYVHFCIASLDYEPVWDYPQAEGPEDQRGWSWKPVYFYILAADETLILVATASSGLQNVCSWGLLAVTVGSWYVGWKLGAVKVMSSRLWKADEESRPLRLTV
ncbi:hypothetical protein QBC41DRAFT_97547 [Cercophora samala]|uniref:Uncharacterized protein n=1 Tax=Cercophora samala TaxID=330535 RepID=A0AA40CVB4_9PEZI|nr:hypothetical protein QBC41DRAFT_97547 [Cercophora samala]